MKAGEAEGDTAQRLMEADPRRFTPVTVIVRRVDITPFFEVRKRKPMS